VSAETQKRGYEVSPLVTRYLSLVSASRGTYLVPTKRGYEVSLTLQNKGFNGGYLVLPRLPRRGNTL
jgi:hypothetical protein